MTKRLNIFDAVTAASRNGYDVVLGKREVGGATDNAAPYSIPKLKPLGFGMSALPAGLPHAKLSPFVVGNSFKMEFAVVPPCLARVLANMR